MTREQLVNLLTDWFAWRFTTRVLKWHPHRGFYSGQLMHMIECEWVSNCATRELLPTVFDVWINPPDLTQSKLWEFEEETWEPNAEFQMLVDGFVWKWFKVMPEDWLKQIAPLLENRITLPRNGCLLYVTARHKALSVIGHGSKRLHERKSNQLYERLEPLCAEWGSLLEEEKDALVCALGALYKPATGKGFSVLTRLKQKVEPAYRENIDRALRQEKGSISFGPEKKSS